MVEVIFDKAGGGRVGGGRAQNRKAGVKFEEGRVNMFWYYSLALEGEKVHENAGGGDNGYVYWFWGLCWGSGDGAGGAGTEFGVGKGELFSESKLGGLIVPEL